MKAIDLHIHSYYSDGTDSPNQLIQMAKRNKLSKVALTDHNTIEGMEEFNYLAKMEGIEAINGVEIDSFCELLGRNIHVLGYGFTDVKKMNQGLNVINQIRNRSIEDYIIMFNNIGISISLDEVKKFQNNDYINGYSIAKVVETKTNMTLPEIRKRYFSQRGDVNTVNLDYVIKMIKDSGGIAILAHPGQTLKGIEVLMYLQLLLKRYSFDGIEAIYPTFIYEQIMYYINIAKDNNLIITCGSDYHRKCNIEIGNVCRFKELTNFCDIKII